MQLFQTQGNVTVEDDWDAVADAYELDAPLPGVKPSVGMPPENACLRVIRQKYADAESKKVDDKIDSSSFGLLPKKIELDYTLKIHLVYN